MTKNYLILFTLTFLLFSCNSESNEDNIVDNTDEFIDSLEVQEEVERKLDERLTNIHWDTVGIDKSGLIVTKARFVSDEYSNYKDIQLTYKNVSGKRIKAIKFSWYGVNAFNEPADCGSLSTLGFGGGFMDDGLGVNRTTTSTWSILSRDGDKVIKAWPTEIAFEDGTKWKSSYQ